MCTFTVYLLPLIMSPYEGCVPIYNHSSIVYMILRYRGPGNEYREEWGGGRLQNGKIVGLKCVVPPLRQGKTFHVPL